MCSMLNVVVFSPQAGRLWPINRALSVARSRQPATLSLSRAICEGGGGGHAIVQQGNL